MTDAASLPSSRLRDLPWVFYTLLSLLVFFPCLILGKTYFHDDLFTYTAPDFEFLAHQLSLGHYPLWNPYLFGGVPYAANPNSLAVYPLVFPSLLFPAGYGTSVFFFMHWILAALGMHFFLLQRNLSQAACRAGALTYVLSGFFWWEMIHLPVLATLSWLPWWLAFLHRMARNGKSGDAFLAGLVFSLLFLSCNYQMSWMALMGGVVYFTFNFRMGGGEWKGWLGKAGFFLWGLIPAVLWLLPSGEFILHSGRFQSAFDYSKLDTSLSLNPLDLWQFLFPVSPLGETALKITDYVDNMGFLGLLAPLFLFLALRRNTRSSWLWAFAALLGIGIALGPLLPLHRWVCELIPGFRFMRAPARAMVFYGFPGCVLTAVGFDRFFEIAKPEAKVQKIIFGILFLSLFIPVWISTPLGDSSILTAPGRAPFLSGIHEPDDWSRVFIDDNIPYPVHWSGNQYLFKYPINRAMTESLRSADGYDSIWLKSYTQALTWPVATFERLLAVQWTVSGSDKKGVRVAKFTETHPFVWVAERETVFTEPQSLEARLAQPDFNPYLETLMLKPPADSYRVHGKEKLSLQWKGQDINTDEEKFQVALARPALLVFSEIYFKGWQAYLDGSPTTLYEADGLLRAVAVPGGTHEIRFSYKPAWFLPCVVAAFLWLFSLPWAFRVLGRDIRKSPPLK